MNCEWDKLTKGSRCRHCGNPLPRDYERPPNCRCKGTKKQGLGDWVESQLSAIGITKQWYVEAKAALGLPPTCGCDARQQWLNKASDWWREKMR